MSKSYDYISIAYVIIVSQCFRCGPELLKLRGLGLARLEQLEKVDPTFTVCAGKPSEGRVTDLGNVAVLALMSRARVIHSDRTANLERSRQYLILFLEESLIAITE